MDRGTSVAGATADLVGDSSAVNVLASHGIERSDTADLDPEMPGYSGLGAGAIGRLHAATEAVDAAEHACLHHPSPDHSAAGPWLVIEPLGGRLSTVHRGSATVSVTCTPPDDGVDGHLRGMRDRLETVIEAARPSHEYYPVHRDELGTFTLGMTTFSLRDVEVANGRPTVTFDVATTPITERSDIVSRFEALEPVSDVSYDTERPVAEANPGQPLLGAVEEAASAVLGDWAYEWGPRPTAFSDIPTPQKVALGTGMPGAEECDLETVEDCRRLLSAAIDALGDDR